MNDVRTTSKDIGLIIPQPQHNDTLNGFNPAKPLRNGKHENVINKIIQGIPRPDAFLLSYPTRKNRESASVGVSQLFRRSDVIARYEYLQEEMRQKGGITQELPNKPGISEGSRDPEGKIDIKTRAGRLSVVEMVVQDYLNGGSVRTDAVLKAVDKLVSMHGDAEALALERSKIPISSIIAYLIQCELAGRDPLKMEFEDMPAVLCKVMRLDYCAVQRASVSHTHRVKGKERNHSELIAHKQGANDDDAMHTVCNDNDIAHDTANDEQPSPSVFETHTPTANPTPPAQIPSSVIPTSLKTPSACVVPEPMKIGENEEYFGPSVLGIENKHVLEEHNYTPAHVGVINLPIPENKIDVPHGEVVAGDTFGQSEIDAIAYEAWRRGGKG